MLMLLLALQLSTDLVTFPAAILNLQRLLAESTEGKAVIAKLEAARAEHLKTLEGKRSEVNQLIQKKAGERRFNEPKSNWNGLPKTPTLN